MNIAMFLTNLNPVLLHEYCHVLTFPSRCKFHLCVTRSGRNWKVTRMLQCRSVWTIHVPAHSPPCMVLPSAEASKAQGTIYKSLGSPVPPVIRWLRSQHPCLRKSSETQRSERPCADGINPLNPVTRGIPPQKSWSSVAVPCLGKGNFYL